MKRLVSRLSPLPIVVAAVVAASSLSGCAALFIGGAMVGGTLVATDRRTSGAQLEDQSIELKGGKRIAEVTDQQKSRVSITSYNRTVLLTGEVQTDTEKAAVEQAVTQLENVRTVVNEVSLAGSNTFSRSGASDALLTSKVKATLIDARDVMANAFKVVTERGTVYLMGIVTQREADRATDLARSISGVQKVVRVFEVVSEDELARLRPAEPPKPATSSNKP